MHLMSAIKAQHFDRSVVGAAMKRCEHGRWWDCLSHVRVLQSKHEVEMDSVTWSWKYPKVEALRTTCDVCFLKRTGFQSLSVQEGQNLG